MTAADDSYRDNWCVWRKTETEFVGQKEPHKLLSSGDTHRTRPSVVWLGCQMSPTLEQEKVDLKSQGKWKTGIMSCVLCVKFNLNW